MTAILDTFTLSDTTREVKDIDKTEVRREKLLCNLAEQGDIAKAMLEGKEYVAVREVAQKDALGNVVFVEKPKRIKHWFYTNNGKNWFLEVRYGNRALELAEGKTAIAIQSKEKIVGTIEKVIEAVIAKELDTAITKAVSKRNAKKHSKK